MTEVKDGTKAVLFYATTLLARREHSKKELAKKLQLKGYAVDQILTVINHLVEKDYLNDDRFIEMIIRARRNRGMGPLKIYAELQKHGFARQQILANEEWQPQLWQQMARSARIKRFGEGLPHKSADRAQQARFLQQRGFMPEQIQAALLPQPQD